MSSKCTEQQHHAMNAYIKLVRAAETVTSNATRHLKEEKLTISQFAVLELLYHKGVQHQSDIARKVLKSCGNITTVIDNLERRELVQRTRKSCDRRFVDVSLTEAGRSLIDRIFPLHAQQISSEMNHLSDSEQLQLGELCRRLGRKLPMSTEKG